MLMPIQSITNYTIFLVSLDTLYEDRDPAQGMFQKQPNHSKAEQRKVRYTLEAGQAMVQGQRNKY